MEFLILFVFGVVCGMIASAKGRSIFGWSMAGVFFGIFALILIIVLPRVEKTFVRPAGWYPDDSGEARWWNGEEWGISREEWTELWYRR